jgi:hypothetical protein
MNIRLHQALEAVLKTHPESPTQCSLTLKAVYPEVFATISFDGMDEVLRYIRRAFNGELQDCYLVTRDGQEVSVPRSEMTVVELKRTAARLRKEATEAIQHADELRSYGNLKKQIDDLDEPTPIR